jgi:hypothetical protein
MGPNGIGTCESSQILDSEAGPVHKKGHSRRIGSVRRHFNRMRQAHTQLFVEELRFDLLLSPPHHLRLEFTYSIRIDRESNSEQQDPMRSIGEKFGTIIV